MYFNVIQTNLHYSQSDSYKNSFCHVQIVYTYVYTLE